MVGHVRTSLMTKCQIIYIFCDLLLPINLTSCDHDIENMIWKSLHNLVNLRETINQVAHCETERVFFRAHSLASAVLYNV